MRIKTAAAVSSERRADGERRLKAKARIAAARHHCNLIAKQLRTCMSSGYWRNMVTSGQLQPLALPGLQDALQAKGAGGWRRPPVGALPFLYRFAQMVVNWHVDGNPRSDLYSGAQLTQEDIAAAMDISPKQWGREDGTLDWLLHHEWIAMLPTAETPPGSWRSKRHGRNMRAREGTPVYVAGNALVELLQLRERRIGRRLRRIAKKLRSQSSGVSLLCKEPSGLLAEGSSFQSAAEKPAATTARAPRESELTWRFLARTTPWRSKGERRERRQRRGKAGDGGGVERAGGELERCQASPAAPGAAIAASVPSAPAAPAPIPWEPPSSPQFAAMPSPEELRAALAGVRAAVDVAPDRVVGPMPLDGESQRLDTPRAPAAIADVLAAILGKGKP